MRAQDVGRLVFVAFFVLAVSACTSNNAIKVPDAGGGHRDAPVAGDLPVVADATVDSPVAVDAAPGQSPIDSGTRVVESRHTGARVLLRTAWKYGLTRRRSCLIVVWW